MGLGMHIDMLNLNDLQKRVRTGPNVYINLDRIERQRASADALYDLNYYTRLVQCALFLADRLDSTSRYASLSP